MMRLIDADALRDKLQAEIDKVNPPFDGVLSSIRCGVRLARNMVEDEPTIDAVPVRHAHWEWDDELGANVCSSCGRPTYDSHDEYVEFMGSKVIALVSPHYCGFCGAKMDGGEGDE